MEPDVAQLEKGLETLVGTARGAAVGRAGAAHAAARMFIRRPALLVFDDLSSALDVETEQAVGAAGGPARPPNGARGLAPPGALRRATR